MLLILCGICGGSSSSRDRNIYPRGNAEEIVSTVIDSRDIFENGLNVVGVEHFSSRKVLRATEKVVGYLLPDVEDYKFAGIYQGPSELSVFLQSFFESLAVRSFSDDELERIIEAELSSYFYRFGVHPGTVGALVVAVSDFVARKHPLS